MAMFSPTATRWTGVVRRTLPDYLGLTNMFFAPQIAVYSGQTSISFDLLIDDDRGVAPLAHWRLDGDPIGKETGETRSITPAYVQIDDSIPVEDQFTRLPGEDPTAPLSAPARRDLMVAREIVRRENRLRRLLEKLASEALVDGAVVLESPKYPRRRLEFGRNPNNRVVLARPWTDPAADPLQDLTDEKMRMMDAYGHDPRMVVMTPAVFGAFSKTDQVKEIRSARLGRHFVTDLEPRAHRGLSYQFSTEEFDIWVCNGSYKDAAGAIQRYLHKDGLLLIDPEAYMGRTGYGAIIHTRTRNEPIEADMFHHFYTTNEGKFEALYSAAAPIVYPMDPDASTWMEVL